MANIIRRENREVARQREQGPGWDPFSSWEPFRVMDALLRLDPFRENRGGFFRGGDTYYPHFDVKETRDGYLFKADVPGVKENDLDLSVTGNVLTISGRREEEQREEGEQYHALERTYGQFTRSFSLPEGVDTSNVKAELKDGVLTVQLGKRPEVQPRKIAIGSGTGQQGTKH
jgi:HSP20 family protein